VLNTGGTKISFNRGCRMNRGWLKKPMGCALYTCREQRGSGGDTGKGTEGKTEFWSRSTCGVLGRRALKNNDPGDKLGLKQSASKGRSNSQQEIDFGGERGWNAKTR